MKQFFANILNTLKITFFLSNQLEVKNKLSLKAAWIQNILYENVGNLIVYPRLMMTNLDALRSGQLTVIGTGNHERALIIQIGFEMLARILQSTLQIAIYTLIFGILLKLICWKKISFKDAQKISIINMIFVSIITTFTPYYYFNTLEGALLVLILGTIIRVILVYKSKYETQLMVRV
ncbi:MAG: hypothetical protein U0525_04700 [Patescibacteria group bacterium]